MLRHNTSLIIMFIIMILTSSNSSAQILLVDHSGSMNGFKNTGMQDSLVYYIAQEVKDIYFFTSGELVPANSQLEPSRKLDLTRTDIWDAFNQAISKIDDADGSGDIWMITDNIYDDGSTESSRSQQDSFYNALRDNPRIARVVVFPMALKFSGNVYGPPDGAGRATIYGELNGYNGIIVYHISIVSNSGNKLSERQTTSAYNLDATLVKHVYTFWATRAKAFKTTGICLKPLNQEGVSVNWAKDKGAIISVLGDGTYPLILHKDQNGQEVLVSRYKFSINKDKSIIAGFGLHFTSQFQSIDIIDAEVTVAKSGFHSSDFNCDAMRVEIIPDRLQKLGSGETTSTMYAAKLKIEGIRFRRSISSYMNAWFKPFWQINGKLRFDVNLFADAISLKQDLSEKYSIPEGEFQKDNNGKIYRLGDLMLRIQPNSQLVHNDKWIPVQMRVAYPGNLIFEVYVLLFLLITLLIFLCWLTWRSIESSPVLIVDGPGKPMKSRQIIWGASVSLDTGRQFIGRVSCLPFGFMQTIKLDPRKGARFGGAPPQFKRNVVTRFSVLYENGRKSAEFTIRRAPYDVLKQDGSTPSKPDKFWKGKGDVRKVHDNSTSRPKSPFSKQSPDKKSGAGGKNHFEI